MSWQATPFSYWMAAAGFVNATLVVVTWRRRGVRGATSFVFVLLGITFWAVDEAILSGLTAKSSYVLWYRLGIVAVNVLPVSVLVFAIEYTGRSDWLTRRRLALLAAEPAVVSALILALPGHELLWQFGDVIMEQPYVAREVQLGAIAQLHYVFSYLLLFVALGLLIRQLLQNRGPFRRQTLLITVMLVVPFVTNVLWLVGASPVPGVDLTVFAFTITDVAIVAALFETDLFDLEPVARHTLVEDMQDAVFVVDDDGRITDANPAAGALVGDDLDSIIGTQASAVVPDYGTLADSPSDDGMSEVTVSDGGGEHRWFDAQVSTLRDDRGQPRGQLIVLRDISERRRIERRFQALTENATDLVAVLDTDGTITYLSPSVEPILGYDSEELIGANAFEFVHPDDYGDTYDVFDRVVDGETPADAFAFEFRIRAADGSWRHLESRTRNLLDNPAVEGIVINGRDVTERVAYRRQLERQNEHLDRFASVVSHDLRNPLNVIDSRIELARRTGDMAHLEAIDEATDRMERLIEDLLTLAKEGETVSETEPVDVGTVAEAAWETVESETASLTVDAERTVEGDPSRLQQLFTNLFRNSIEHGPEESTSDSDGGHPTDEDLTVRVVDTPDGFAVEDDGRGIPADEYDAVFEWGHSTDPDGTGFGLAIVEQVVTAHGWSITVEAGESGGARFTIATA